MSNVSTAVDPRDLIPEYADLPREEDPERVPPLTGDLEAFDRDAASLGLDQPVLWEGFEQWRATQHSAEDSYP